MKKSDALGNQIGKHLVERQEIVGWCTGSRIIPWEDFVQIVSRNVAKIRKLAPADPWQSLSLGEIKKWWPTQYEATKLNT